MNLKLFNRITELFKLKLSTKTGWGRNEAIEIYKDCVAQATLEVLDIIETEKPNNK
jgi:hypothetical protein